jgi:hypothetical protein
MQHSTDGHNSDNDSRQAELTEFTTENEYEKTNTDTQHSNNHGRSTIAEGFANHDFPGL